MPASAPIIILDAGPLVAVANAADQHNGWAARFFAETTRPIIVTSAAVAETTHLLGNAPRALAFLGKLVARFRVEDPHPVEVLAEMARWGRHMDYADACAVLLFKTHKGSVVVTTDHRDFATYRVPFLSPKGSFHA